MNAVHRLAMALSYPQQRRLLDLPVRRFDDAGDGGGDVGDDAREASPGERLRARYQHSLIALLNACGSEALAEMLIAVGLPPAPRPADARLALWRWGARLEAGGTLLGPPLQPTPVLLAGRLVLQAPPQGAYPPSTRWPRPLPPPRGASPPADEPDSLDELLAAADALIGVRLGERGRDKGAWGARAAALLGIPERGDDEPDWRGDVEVKTVPVAAQPDGRWRVLEDPAISMLDAAPVTKLQHVLWLARAGVGARDATIVGWYLLRCEGDVPRLVRRYLHTRPKGPRGTDARGWYLHKRFFAEAGLLATLNGP